MFIESRGSVAPGQRLSLASCLPLSRLLQVHRPCHPAAALSLRPPPALFTQPFRSTDPPTPYSMRSKFKDEHPFGRMAHPVDVRSQLIHRCLPQISARRRQSASGRSTPIGYPCVVPLVHRILPTYRLHGAPPYRSYARRQTRRISPRLTRRSIWYHQCVLFS